MYEEVAGQILPRGNLCAVFMKAANSESFSDFYVGKASVGRKYYLSPAN